MHAASGPSAMPIVHANGLDIHYRVTGEGAETEVFFSDLSHEYVTINADYTT